MLRIASTSSSILAGDKVSSVTWKRKQQGQFQPFITNGTEHSISHLNKMLFDTRVMLVQVVIRNPRGRRETFCNVLVYGPQSK
jgi:hypothetical protein